MSAATMSSWRDDVTAWLAANRVDVGRLVPRSRVRINHGWLTCALKVGAIGGLVDVPVMTLPPRRIQRAVDRRGYLLIESEGAM